PQVQSVARVALGAVEPAGRRASAMQTTLIDIPFDVGSLPAGSRAGALVFAAATTFAILAFTGQLPGAVYLWLMTLYDWQIGVSLWCAIMIYGIAAAHWRNWRCRRLVDRLNPIDPVEYFSKLLRSVSLRRTDLAMSAA